MWLKVGQPGEPGWDKGLWSAWLELHSQRQTPTQLTRGHSVENVTTTQVNYAFDLHSTGKLSFPVVPQDRLCIEGAASAEKAALSARGDTACVTRLPWVTLVPFKAKITKHGLTRRFIGADTMATERSEVTYPLPRLLLLGPIFRSPGQRDGVGSERIFERPPLPWRVSRGATGVKTPDNQSGILKSRD